MGFNIFQTNYNSSDYFVVKYFLESKTDLADAAWNLAIGQSVGNPNIRNKWETDYLFEQYSCRILQTESYLSSLQSGEVDVLFPVQNLDWQTDGVSQLLCHIMGGHTDIDIINKCVVKSIDFPSHILREFLGPKYGIKGIRNFTGVYDKPLVGGIVKPKIGIDSNTLLDLVKELVDGGVNFIKEDEIMSNPSIAPLEERVDLISNYLAKQSNKVVFCHTINCDPHLILDRVQKVHDLGGNGVHINVFSGWGAYNSIRKLDLPIFLHLQSSGSKLFCDPRNPYHISWKVLCYLSSLMGVDTIQTGMVGGYSNHGKEELKECISILQQNNTLPALSCGMHPGLVEFIKSELNSIDWLANVGGAIHGHPDGTKSGAKAMIQAVNQDTEEREYLAAIEKWGLVKPT
jgi:ribulose 1,5-bisphosphate carboxylase large subunit-like protein